eukprot:jgi/Botrbrau1/15873/Bobra.40_1s0057.1
MTTKATLKARVVINQRYVGGISGCFCTGTMAATKTLHARFLIGRLGLIQPLPHGWKKFQKFARIRRSSGPRSDFARNHGAIPRFPTFHSDAAEKAQATSIGYAVGLHAAGFGACGVACFTASALAAADMQGAAAFDLQAGKQYVCKMAQVPGSAVDALGEALMELGALAVTVEESREGGSPEQPIFGDGRSLKVWDRCTVSAMFGSDRGVEDAVRSACQLAGLEETPSYQLDEVVDRQWVESIKASYRALEVAEGVWIVPTWCEAPQPSAANIVMEPGLAFGTGEHPTTRLCLRWLLEQDWGGCALLDYGTGSGILAIAALVRGAAFAAGTDTDPQALSAARRNAALNSVEGRLALVPCTASRSPTLAELRGSGSDPTTLAEVRGSRNDSVPGQPQLFDACVANILQGPILELCESLAACVRPGGVIGLSGILDTQAPAVQESYSRYFTDFKLRTEGPWALLTGRRI